MLCAGPLKHEESTIASRMAREDAPMGAHVSRGERSSERPRRVPWRNAKALTRACPHTSVPPLLQGPVGQDRRSRGPSRPRGGGERESTDVEAHRTPRGRHPQAAPATPRRGVYRLRAQRESQRQDTEQPRAAAKQEGVPPCPTWHPGRPTFLHPP